VFEVGWARLIALIIGPTTYAFALMAGSFIVGISLGARLGLRLARTGSHRALWLCAMLALSAAATLGAAWFTALQLPLIIARYVNEASAFGPLLVREALVLGVTLIAASAGFGATFTLALALGGAGTDRPARESARVYMVNTAGAVAGALAAGFLLLPRLGIETTFLVTSRLLIATAAVLAAACAVRWRTLRRNASMIAAAAALVFLGTFALPGWNRDVLASGFYKYSRGVSLEDIAIGARAGHLEYYKEGAAGTVSVTSLAGTRSLAIDGKVDASNGGDMLTQRLLGVLPMLAHHEARTALVIGLGSGVTAAAARATQAVHQLDIVEISPEVVEAAALFERENGGILNKAGARLLLGDGRTHLQLTSRRYDVIVSEPSNPWMAGVAALFTREFFEAVKRRLTADGVFCQWTHTYELEADDLRSIVGTFAAVFPNATMWLVGDGDLLLIGARNEAEQLLQNIDRRSREAPPQPLLDQGVARESIPFFLMSLYAGGPAELASFARGAVLQEDDRMALEFSAARAMYAPPEGSAARLRTAAGGTKDGERAGAVLSAARADDWINRGDIALRAEALEMAHDSYRRAADLDRRSIAALRGAASAAAALGRLEEEISWLRDRSHAKADHLAATVALSSALAMRGDLEAAAAAAADATRADPAEPLALEQLASVAADLGDVDRLAPAAEALIARFPDRADSRYYKAAVLFMRGRIGEAKAETALLLERHPAHARGHNLLGIACASTDDFACARSAFDASLRANPRDASVYTNLGNMHLEMGDRETAIRLFSEAVAVDSGATAARETLQAIAPR
jgi:spermidine synthase